MSPSPAARTGESLQTNALAFVGVCWFADEGQGVPVRLIAELTGESYGATYAQAKRGDADGFVELFGVGKPPEQRVRLTPDGFEVAQLELAPYAASLKALGSVGSTGSTKTMPPGVSRLMHSRERLLVFAALARGAGTADEIASRAGLPARTTRDLLRFLSRPENGLAVARRRSADTTSVDFVADPDDRRFGGSTEAVVYELSALGKQVAPAFWRAKARYIAAPLRDFEEHLSPRTLRRSIFSTPGRIDNSWAAHLTAFQALILLETARAGEVNPRELAEVLDIPPDAVPNTIRMLVTEGAVAPRSPDVKEGNEYIYLLTERGRRLANEVMHVASTVTDNVAGRGFSVDRLLDEESSFAEWVVLSCLSRGQQYTIDQIDAIYDFAIGRLGSETGGDPAAALASLLVRRTVTVENGRWFVPEVRSADWERSDGKIGPLARQLMIEGLHEAFDVDGSLVIPSRRDEAIAGTDLSYERLRVWSDLLHEEEPNPNENGLITDLIDDGYVERVVLEGEQSLRLTNSGRALALAELALAVPVMDRLFLHSRHHDGVAPAGANETEATQRIEMAALLSVLTDSPMSVADAEKSLPWLSSITVNDATRYAQHKLWVATRRILAESVVETLTAQGSGVAAFIGASSDVASLLRPLGPEVDVEIPIPDVAPESLTMGQAHVLFDLVQQQGRFVSTDEAAERLATTPQSVAVAYASLENEALAVPQIVDGQRTANYIATDRGRMLAAQLAPRVVEAIDRRAGHRADRGPTLLVSNDPLVSTFIDDQANDRSLQDAARQYASSYRVAAASVAEMQTFGGIGRAGVNTPDAPNFLEFFSTSRAEILLRIAASPEGLSLGELVNAGVSKTTVNKVARAFRAMDLVIASDDSYGMDVVLRASRGGSLVAKQLASVFSDVQAAIDELPSSQSMITTTEALPGSTGLGVWVMLPTIIRAGDEISQSELRIGFVRTGGALVVNPIAAAASSSRQLTTNGLAKTEGPRSGYSFLPEALLRISAALQPLRPIVAQVLDDAEPARGDVETRAVPLRSIGVTVHADALAQDAMSTASAARVRHTTTKSAIGTLSDGVEPAVVERVPVRRAVACGLDGP